MRKIIVVVGFIVLLLITSNWFLDLSFTRTGGEDFESITPPVDESYSINELIKDNKIISNKIIMDEDDSNIIVSFKDLHLKTWFMDAQYYFGKQLNANAYDDFILPDSYEIPIYSSLNSEILAVKITYLDLTDFGKKNLHALISEDAKVKMIKTIGGYTLMEYNKFQLLLNDNVLYYFRTM